MNAPLEAPEERVAEDDATALAAHFELGGRRCRVVCVDDRLPTHHTRPGSSRVWERYLPDELVHFQLEGHRYAIVAERAVPAPPVADARAVLTNRELQIVQLICSGLLTKQVGDRLRISEFTVRSYLKTIYCKLGVRSRGAMVYAYAQSFARAPRGPET